jgi:23S rRNA pseudouridine2604 synthase
LRPAEVQQERNNTLRFILKEGRNRQIRRMCELVDLRVLDLQRIRVGPILLAGLPEGKWRPLGAKERAALLAAGAGEEVRWRPPRREDRPRSSDGPARDRAGAKPRQDRAGKPRSGERADRDGGRPERKGPRPDRDGPRPERAGTKPDRAGAKPPGPGGKPARPGAKPVAAPPKADGNRPSALKGDKFKRTKLAPRDRKPIK